MCVYIFLYISVDPYRFSGVFSRLTKSTCFYRRLHFQDVAAAAASISGREEAESDTRGVTARWQAEAALRYLFRLK